MKKKWLPWIIVGVFALWLGGSLRTPPDKDFAFNQFGRLPLEFGGRVQPFDSLARNTLLQLREKQTANLEPWKGWSEKPQIISASEWLLSVMTKPEEADAWPVFRIDNPDVKGLLGLPGEPDKVKHLDGKHFSWLQIQPKLQELEREAIRADHVEPSRRSPYHQGLIRLRDGEMLYSRLKATLGPASSGDLATGLGPYLQKGAIGLTAYRANMEKKPYDEADFAWFVEQLQAPLVIPPAPGTPRETWSNTLKTILQSDSPALAADAALRGFADMARAYRANSPAEFNTAVAAYRDQLLRQGFQPELKKVRSEQYFNFLEPFYKAMVIDVCAFLLVLAYWFKPGGWDWLRVSAVGLVLLALLMHTGGLIFRMCLEGRPPVTNLYSSAIFIGWGATVLGLLLERFWRNSIGVMVSCIIGFLTLIIAHHLRLGGDTMEMMRAVLDTNFWLATHVVVVTLGYASTFVAGVLAVIYIVLGVFTPKLTQDLGRSLNRMIYGIVCFATLFSFVGTVLGGIWADQSWGRFWGWDVKENGALIIVLWNALILHARWGGLVRERGLANLAIFGNIVTSWSWFGVNMLGVGLHSYGFTSAAFQFLILFVGINLILISLGLLPTSLWRSFQARPAPASPAPAGARPKPA